MAMSAIAIMSCTSKEEGPAYIGPSDIKVENGLVTPEVLLSLGRLSDPQLSPDGSEILYGVTYTSIEENRTCRNLYVCNVDGSSVRPLTKSGRSISNARWIAGGSKIAYLKGGQVYVAPYSGGKLGKAQKVTDVERGISEFSISPDESRILYVSTIPSNVKTPKDSDPMLDKAGAYETEDLMYRHWDHWVTELPHSYVAPFGRGKVTAENSVDILGGPDVKFELPLEPHSGIEQLCWSPDGKYIAYSCKKLTGREYAFSTNTEIYVYGVETGETVVIPVGGGYDTDPVWSPDGKHIAWTSMPRDGYEADKTRLMVADVELEGGIRIAGVRDLTADYYYNATSPVWSADSRYIYFSSLVEGLQGIFRADIEKAPLCGTAIRVAEIAPGAKGGSPVYGAAIERLTPETAWYDFHSPFAILEDGTLLATYCSMDFPTELVAVKDYNFKQISFENEHILSQVKPHITEARHVTTVDGQDMLTWVLFPPEFDSTKTYPAIEIFLGGPQGTLSQEWSYRWNYLLMADQGYIVVLPNRRGTTAFGQPWCEAISGDYIGLDMQDYLSAARMIKSEPYVGKLAGCGASFGGFSVYYMAGIHGDVFDCFIAHAGIFDEKYMYYETEEMWFPNFDNGGLREFAYSEGQTGPAGDGITFGGIQQAGSPWSSEAKARRHYTNSPDINVTKWHTPILCIHGCLDFRIPYDQGMAAFNAAQMMGVPSKLIIFPEENHWIVQPQNALFWHRSYFDWLDRWCRQQ